MPRVKINGTEIFYGDEGPHDAPVIVLSPLLYMDTSVYKPIVHALSDDHRVICYDHRGQGQSAHVRRSDLQATTKDAATLIEYLNIGPCHFFGNCLGAYVGLNLMVQRSDLLKSGILIGAIAEAYSPKEIKELDTNLDMMKKAGAKSSVQNFAHMCFGPTFRASTDPLIVERREKILESFVKLSAEELENARQIYHHQNISKEDLQQVETPVLVIAGDEDQPGNLAAYKRLAQMIPHVNYKTVHHAGYCVALEQPQEVVNLVRDHIEKAERGYMAMQNTLKKKSKNKSSRLRH